MLEPQGQDGPCVKPAAALDLMLHSRKGPYQSLMAREDVRIKRVPTALAYALAKRVGGQGPVRQHLLRQVGRPGSAQVAGLRPPRFLRRSGHRVQGCCLEVQPGRRAEVPRRARPEAQAQVPLHDVEPSPAWRPYELGYAPTALAVSSPEKGWAIETDEEDGKRGHEVRLARRDSQVHRPLGNPRKTPASMPTTTSFIRASWTSTSAIPSRATTTPP